jgi:UDP-N-acetylmuramyl tripeptide synthase
MQEDEDMDDDDDEDIVEDALPINCDPVLYERVLDLREKRLDTDEISADIQKSVDELKKTIERLKQREKQITKDTQASQVEMQQFQLQKQLALNQIDVVVPLKLSQLYAFDNSGLFTVPSDQQAVQTVIDNFTASSSGDANNNNNNAAAAAAAAAAASNANVAELRDLVANLRDPGRRRVVNEIGVKSHVLLNKR